MENIQLETVTNFKLTSDELRAMYVRLALFRFPYLRNPEYNENLLLDRLTEYFGQISGELNKLKSENKNNHAIYKVTSFFDLHYKNLLELKTPQTVL